MFCEKCGTPLADGESFCGNCGAPVTPVQQPYAQSYPQPQSDQQPYGAVSYDQSPDVSPDQSPYADNPYAQQPDGQQPDGMYTYHQAPEKQRKPINKKRLGIIAGAIVGCVAIFIVIALVTGLFKSDKDKMHSVTKDAVHNLFSRFEDLTDDVSLDDLGSFTFEIEPGQTLKTLGSTQGIDLSWLNKAKIAVATDVTDDGKIMAAAGITLNDVEIGTINAVVDTQKGEILLGVDGLSDSMAKIDLNAAGMGGMRMSGMSSMDMSELTEIMRGIDTDEIADMLEDYIDAAIDALDSADKSSGSITANGVTADCDLYTINLSQKSLMNVAKKIISKALKDGDFEDLLEKIYPLISQMSGEGAIDFDDFYDQFEEQMEQMVDTIDQAQNYLSDETLATITEYVNDNELVGIRVASGAAAGRDSFDIFFGIADDGSNFGVELTAMGQTFLKGSGTKDGDALNGDIQVIVQDKPVCNLKLIGFNLDTGDGALEISLPSDVISRMGMDSQMASLLSTLSLRLEKTGNAVSFDLNLKGISAVKATLTKDGKKTVAVNTGLPTTDPENWSQTLNIDALKERLIRAGMPQSMLNNLLAQTGMSSSGSGDPWGSDEDPFYGENNIELTVWTSQEDVTTELCKKFIEQYPNKVISINIETVSEGDVASRLLNDPQAADVFGFACDQLAKLKDSRILSPLEYEDADKVSERDSAFSVQSASIDGELYAYPMTGSNGYYLVYDKRYISDADAATLEGVLKACRKANKKFVIDAGNGFYSCIFPLTGGMELVGVDENAQLLNAYDKEEVLDALEAFNKLLNEYSDVVQNSLTAKIASGMKENPSLVAAGIDGDWNIAAVQNALGDNYGAAKLPTIQIKGQNTQIISVNGPKLMGVNCYSQYPYAANLLAEFLTNEESQQERVDAVAWAPSNKAVAASDAVRSNPGLSAVLEQSNYSQPQNLVAVNFWSPSGTLGKYLADGAHTRAEIAAQFDEYIKTIQDL